MRVAVMQPYFYPYMGYFRLIAAADVFVLFDCVQFPRRGRVHRCDMGESRWLTLPMARQPRDTRIADLCFAEGAQAEFARRCAAFPELEGGGMPHTVVAALRDQMTSVVDYLEANLRAMCQALGLTTRITRSSKLDLPPNLKRAERVRAVAKAHGARRYVNAPGGRSLYDAAFFGEAGMTLEFLAPYEGPHIHMLRALATVPLSELKSDAAAWKVEPA